MDSKSWLQLIRQHRAIAVIRTADPQQGLAMARAVVAGQMHLVEVTWNSQQPADLVRRIRQEISLCTVGAGTVLNREQLQQAIAAGAQFIFTPHTNPHLIQTALDQGVAIIPGSLTPSEILLAWQMGASSVKVFPAEALGGANYIRSLQGPLGHIPLIATGGITLDNSKAFLMAGAVGIGLSSSLFPPTLIANAAWDSIRQRALTLVQQLQPSSEQTDSL